MNDFERATLNTLDRDYQMWELVEVLGNDPNYWPSTIRLWIVDCLETSLNQDQTDPPPGAHIP